MMKRNAAPVAVGIDERFRCADYTTLFQCVNDMWNPNGNVIGLNPDGLGVRFGSSVALDMNTLISGALGEGIAPLGEFFAPGATSVDTLPGISQLRLTAGAASRLRSIKTA